MSKSQEFRLRVQLRERHDYRKRKAEEVKEANDKEFKDELRRVGRGDNDQEQRPPVHPKQQTVRRGDKG